MRERHLFAPGIVIAMLVAWSPRAHALDPSLEVSQYAHTSWTVRGGFSLGAVFAMAQTPDGYLWLGSEFGLFRFDGVNFAPWQAPGGEQLPARNINSLLSARDGTLWIGTFAGLASWHDGRLVRFHELDNVFITSLLEDRQGTVWVGGMSDYGGHLCAVRSGHARCEGQRAQFGRFVWSFREDRAGALWVGADSGLWRWAPGVPRRYPIPGAQVGDLSEADDGHLVIGIRDRALRQLIDERIEPYPIHNARAPLTPLQDAEVDSNKLLRDRDGALWIATASRGLIHVVRGRADTFSASDGLAGDISCSLFEDREGTIWVATTGGLDRFQQSSVATFSKKQGLPSNDVVAVLGTTDGSVWLAARDGLMRWTDGHFAMVGTTSGLPAGATQSLFEDSRRRVWVFTKRGLAYFDGKRFHLVPGVSSNEVFSITGDEAGNLWVSGDAGLTHLRADHVVEDVSWETIGRARAKVVVADRGGVWMSFWTEGGVMYFKDGQVRASYSVRDGLGKGHVPGLALDRDGALWASTELGGLSRIKDGRVATLTTANGLPCNTIHGTVEDDRRSLWVYAGCGVIRITRPELDAWIAEPSRRVQTTVWDAADGAKLRALAPTSFEPLVSRSTDGKLWFVAGEGIQVLDPRHVASNSVGPPVHVERLTADATIRWQRLPGETAGTLRLPPRVRDVQIDYSALSLAAPEKIHFKYKLEGQDHAWREVVNDRRVQYSNLTPGAYRFRVIASNNSGVWNEHGDTLVFSVEPAYYQTAWFWALCACGTLSLLWCGYQLRVRQLQHEFEMTLDARVSERTRIARDLHDTLLQSFHGLLLKFQTASQVLRERPAEAQEKIDQAIDQAAKAIVEGRDAVQGLRASTVEQNNLAAAIKNLGDELAAVSTPDPHPTFDVTIEGHTRDLHPIVRDEIYKIAAEALRNAFRHAQATRVAVEIHYDAAQFQLHVRDDGRGIDTVVLANAGREGHYGLGGMTERANVIGGTLALWSEVGTGTEVELRLPGSIVYATETRRSWLSRLLASAAPARVRGDAS